MKKGLFYAARRQALIEQFGTEEAADLYLAEEAKLDASDAVQALKAERSRGRASLDSAATSATPPESNVWPWGTHQTKLLGDLAAAARQWWGTFDPPNNATAPTNDDVSAWLVNERAVSVRMAEAMATILRADGVPTGPRT